MHPVFDSLGFLRRAEQETLTLVTLERLKKLELLEVFNALGNYVEPQTVA